MYIRLYCYSLIGIVKLPERSNLWAVGSPICPDSPPRFSRRLFTLSQTL